MGLRNVIQSIREYPSAYAELEKVRAELRQAQDALEKSNDDWESLWLTSEDQQDHINFLSHKSEALQEALEGFCPQLSTAKDAGRLFG